MPLPIQIEELYLNIINSLCDGVYFVDNERKIQFWNKAAEEITGYSAEEMVGKCCQDSLLNHIDLAGSPLCIVGCPLFTTIVDGQQRKDRVFVRHKKGYRIPILVNIFPVYKDGEVIGAIEVFTQDSPVVYEDNLIENLAGNAMHDPLTGMPNRRYMENFLEYRFNEYKRFQKLFAVVFADIDNFGAFNTQYGHDAGDAVLVGIAASLGRTRRTTDLIGRWGGEELLGTYSIAKPSDAPILAEKFRMLVENTEVMHNDEFLKVSVSVGVTIANETDTTKSIVERADRLMYESKRAGKNRITFD